MFGIYDVIDKNWADTYRRNVTSNNLDKIQYEITSYPEMNRYKIAKHNCAVPSDPLPMCCIPKEFIRRLEEVEPEEIAILRAVLELDYIIK